MAKYIFLTDTSQKALLAFKTTVANPGDGDWSAVDVAGSPEYSSPIKSIWAYEQETVAYDFDASDAGPNDPGGVWTDDANAFDGDDTTLASTSTSGSASADYLEGEGTNAPASGPTINSASLYITATEDAPNADFNFRVTTDGAAETLLEDFTGAFTSLADFLSEPLATPAGGWTWAIAQALEIRIWQTGGSTLEARRVQVIFNIKGGGDIAVATQHADGRVNFAIFDPGTDTWTVANEKVAEIGDFSAFDAAPTEPACSLIGRLDNRFTIGFTVENAASSQDEVFAAKRSQAGTWTYAGIGVTPSVNAGGVVLTGPAVQPGQFCNRINFMWTEASTDVRRRGMSSRDSLTTEQAIDTSIDTSPLLVGPGIMTGRDRVYTPYIDADNQVTLVNHILNNLASPTLAFDTGISDVAVYGHGRTAAPFAAFCLAVDDVNFHLLYADDATQDLQHDAQADDGGGTDAELLAGTINRINGRVNGTQLQYVYDDAGVTKYGFFDRPNETFTALSDGKLGVQNFYAGPFEA